MISVEEAKRMMMAAVRTLPVEHCVLGEAAGRFAAGELISPHDHPHFNMSAVDGYAFAFDDAMERRLVGAVAAGEVFGRRLERGECVRIFTGAMLPAGADTVVMQEQVTLTGDRVGHGEFPLAAGANVRRKGEQLHTGDIVLHKGSFVDAAAVGLLATVGIMELALHRRPAVGVLTTGGEFADPAAPEPGKVFNSNDAMLRVALRHEAANMRSERIVDDERLLSEAIERAMAAGDLVITTGGASVGDHDLIRPVLESLGATIHFHGVAQKPGKPMLFAMLNDKPIFALPGNPRAVMVLFWEYALPFLRAMQGAKDPWLKCDMLPLAHALSVKGERAEFRAAQVKGGKVTLLADEGSHMLRSFVDADALAYLPATRRAWIAGEVMEVHYIPR